MLYRDGKAITQSNNILRIVGRMNGGKLYPADKVEAIDEVLGLVEDLKSTWAPAIYMSMSPTIYGYPKGYNKTEEGAAKVKEIREMLMATEVPRFAKIFSGIITAAGGKFACGDEPTIADCESTPVPCTPAAVHFERL